jgi:hypothetical protein
MPASCLNLRMPIVWSKWPARKMTHHRLVLIRLKLILLSRKKNARFGRIAKPEKLVFFIILPSRADTFPTARSGRSVFLYTQPSHVDSKIDVKIPRAIMCIAHQRKPCRGPASMWRIILTSPRQLFRASFIRIVEIRVVLLFIRSLGCHVNLERNVNGPHVHSDILPSGWFPAEAL